MAQSNEAVRYRMNSFIHNHANSMLPNNFDVAFWRALNTISVSIETDQSPAKAAFALTIPKTYGNNPTYGSVHGGAVATFFDSSTSLVMMAVRRGWGHSGVTRTLVVTYVRPVMEGEKCVIEAEAVQVGRAVATIKGELKRENDGVVLAICQHEKVKPGDDRGQYVKL